MDTVLVPGGGRRGHLVATRSRSGEAQSSSSNLARGHARCVFFSADEAGFGCTASRFQAQGDVMACCQPLQAICGGPFSAPSWTCAAFDAATAARRVTFLRLTLAGIEPSDEGRSDLGWRGRSLGLGFRMSFPLSRCCSCRRLVAEWRRDRGRVRSRRWDCPFLAEYRGRARVSGSCTQICIKSWRDDGIVSDPIGAASAASARGRAIRNPLGQDTANRHEESSCSSYAVSRWWLRAQPDTLSSTPCCRSEARLVDFGVMRDAHRPS